MNESEYLKVFVFGRDKYRWGPPIGAREAGPQPINTGKPVKVGQRIISPEEKERLDAALERLNVANF